MLFTIQLFADAWGQHYAKCYTVSKRYRAHANVSALKCTNLGMTCCMPGEGCIYSCTGCQFNCKAFYSDSWWKISELSKVCSGCAEKSTSINQNFNLCNGFGYFGQGGAYSKHCNNYALDITWSKSPYIKAGCNYYTPVNIDTTIDRAGYSNTVLEGKIGSNGRYSIVKDVSGHLMVRKNTLWTSVVRIYVVLANFNPEYEENDSSDNCINLSGYTILDQGELYLNGFGVSKSGLFIPYTISPDTLNTDSGTAYYIDLSQMNIDYSYRVASGVDTNLVSIITFADSYYDFDSEFDGKTNINDALPHQTELKFYCTHKGSIVSVHIEPSYSGDGIISLFDLSGKEVLQISNGYFNAGKLHKIDFTTDGISSGIYFLRYADKIQTKSIKLNVAH